MGRVALFVFLAVSLLLLALSASLAGESVSHYSEGEEEDEALLEELLREFQEETESDTHTHTHTHTHSERETERDRAHTPQHTHTSHSAHTQARRTPQKKTKNTLSFQQQRAQRTHTQPQTHTKPQTRSQTHTQAHTKAHTDSASPPQDTATQRTHTATTQENKDRESAINAKRERYKIPRHLAAPVERVLALCHVESDSQRREPHNAHAQHRPGRDFFAVLGVPRTASESEVKKRYRELARELHPDKNPHPDARIAFDCIAAAHETLSDPLSRTAYTQHLDRCVLCDSRTTHSHKKNLSLTTRLGSLIKSFPHMLIRASLGAFESVREMLVHLSLLPTHRDRIALLAEIVQFSVTNTRVFVGECISSALGMCRRAK